MILALDTSTDQASAALLDEQVLQSEWSWRTKGSPSRQLHRVIAEMLALSSIDPHSISLVSVAIGPGSFSGVRVAISFGKGLAMGLDIPLVGVSTLDVIGFQASIHSDDVWAILPAGRNQVYAARYIGQGREWRREGDYRVLLPGELESELGNATLAGEGVERLIGDGRFDNALRPGNSGPWAIRRAVFLAELGKNYLHSGGHDQSSDLEPLYLRPSAAEEKRAAYRQE